MSHSLNSLKGVLWGTLRVIEEATTSLDYSSHELGVKD